MRLRWANGRLSNGVEDRKCPADALIALYTEVDARLGKAWTREDMRTVGDRLAAWLPWPVTRGCRFEVAGHPALVHLPWELLRHQGEYLAAKRPAFEPVRRVDAATADTTPPDAGPHSLAVLFMAAAPEGQQRLAYEDEERRIEDALVSQDGLMLDLVVGGSVDALNDKLALLDDWAAVHLSAHGRHDPPQLALEDAFAQTALTGPYDLDLHPGGQRLLVVSACASAQAEAADAPSLAYALADAGVAPCVIGFGAKVSDSDATDMAAQLYHHLNQAKTVSRALADTRFALIRDGVDDPRAWAALRQFVTESGGGKLAQPRARRTPRDIQTRRHPMRKTRVGAGALPTAPTGRFVGRRKLLRQTIQALGPTGKGALLTGQGGVGKSSLAAQALRRFIPHTPVELFRDFSPLALFHALRAALKDDAKAQAALSDSALQEAQDPKSPALRLSLAQAVQCDAARRRPLIFVFDDLEAAMVKTDAGEFVLRDGRHQLNDAPAQVLRALLIAIDETPHRVLLTSRYPTTVPDARGVDLLAPVTRIEMGRPTPDEQRRMIRQADRYDDDGKARPPGYTGLEGRLQARAAKVAGHNPRLLNRLHAALVGGADVALLDKLEGYLDGGGKQPEEFLDMFNDLVIQQLITLAGPDGQALLNGLTAFSVPAPVDALCAGLGCTPAAIDRLIDLTLVERLPDGLVGLPALVRPEVETCDAETAGLLYGPFIDALPTDWQPTPDGEWNGPAERAEFVFEAAMAAQPIRDALAGAAGAEHIRNLIGSNHRRHARALTDRVTHLTPNPWLLARLAEAWWGTDSARCAALIEATRAALPSAPPAALAIYVLRRQAQVDVTRGAPDDALEHLRTAQPLAENDSTRATLTGEIARILTDKGKVDEALALHREMIDVFEALEDRRSRAVTLGDIARILTSKGKVDEALALHREEMEVYEALEDRRSRAVTLGDIARILTSKGKVDEALALHRERLEVYEALEDRRSRAVTLGDIARILTDKGKVDEALALHRERLEVYEALEDRRSRAVTLGDIARILTDKGKVDEALALHREQIEVFEALEDRRSRAVTLGDIARIHADRGGFAEAKRLQDERIRENEALGDLDGIGAACCDRGAAMLRAGDSPAEMAPFFGKSFAIFRQIGRVDFIGTSGFYYGLVLARLGQFAEARAALEASRDAWRMLGALENLTRVEGLLAQLPAEGNPE